MISRVSLSFMKQSKNRIIRNNYYLFSKLPEPSRFASTMGLQKIFEETVIKAEKNEKATTTFYSWIIGVSLCAMCTLFITYLSNPQVRRQIRLSKMMYEEVLGFQNETNHSKLL